MSNEAPTHARTQAAADPPPSLVPRLGLTGLVIFGVSYMAPAVVIATFGVIAVLSQGATPLAYAVATAAMVLTALSYCKLAREFPSSGSIYTYARRVIGSRFGFLAGWTILLDYLFLPMVAWLITGLYLSAQFPALPSWAGGLIVIAITTAVNVIGLKLADRLNRALLLLVMIAVAAVVLLGIGGPSFAGAVNIAMVVGTLASCIAVQASGSRLLFVMGRDGVLPKRFFGVLQARFRTPVPNLLLIAAIGVAGQFLTMGDAASLINFGAFLAFAVANVCVIVLWARRRGAVPGRWRLLGWLIVPVIGFAVDIFLLLQLSPLALGIGSGWLLLGVVYLLVLTKGFTRPAPGLMLDPSGAQKQSAEA